MSDLDERLEKFLVEIKLSKFNSLVDSIRVDCGVEGSYTDGDCKTCALHAFAKQEVMIGSLCRDVYAEAKRYLKLKKIRELLDD